MRGLTLIIAYLLGNEKVREWLIKNICKTSLVIDKKLNLTEPKKEKKDEL